MPASFVVVANPENRRVAFFRAAVARAGLPPPTVIPWIEVLGAPDRLTRAVSAGSIVRFDSPGEDDAVERELLALGAEVDDPEAPRAARLSATQARALSPDRGLIRAPRQWYLGFCEALRRCKSALSLAPCHQPLQQTDDIPTMFDKRRCHALLLEKGVPVPRALERVRGWEDLRARMRETAMPRVFVKLAFGSSASGMVALESRKNQVVGRTTVEIERGLGEVRLYNRLRVARMTDERSLATLVDALCAEGVHVERWLPKAGIDGRLFDLRVLVVEGRARQIVVRTSRGPITNLHLGNRRGDVERVRAAMGAEAFEKAISAAESALDCFPGTRYAGVDLLIGASFARHAVLEINAFGDLLPNAFCEGQDSYGTIVEVASGLAVAKAPSTSPLGPWAPTSASAVPLDVCP